MPTSDTLLFRMLKGGVDKRSRDAIGRSIAHTIREENPSLLSKSALSEADLQAVETVERLGLAPLPPLFPPQEIPQIKGFLADKPMKYFMEHAGFPDTEFGAHKPTGYRFGTWQQEVISSIPAIMAKAHDPRLFDIAEKYLGTVPTLSQVRIWESYSSDLPAGKMQFFHHDTDDFRALKVFVHFSDVTDKTGPHQYVPESHTIQALDAMVQRGGYDRDRYLRLLKWMETRFKPDEDVQSYFPRVETLTGPAGFTFLEESMGLHKGLVPLEGSRLIFNLCFAMMPRVSETLTVVPRSPAIRVDERTAYVTRLFYK